MTHVDNPCFRGRVKLQFLGTVEKQAKIKASTSEVKKRRFGRSSARKIKRGSSSRLSQRSSQRNSGKEVL